MMNLWKGTVRRVGATLLACVLLLGLLPQLPRQAGAAYTDSYLQQMVDWGFMRGDISGNLRPDNPISRAEFVTVINRALGYEKLGGDPFQDVPDSAWYAEDVDIAYTEGYISGTSKTTFSPDSSITREEAAIILTRNLMLQPDTGENTSFTDSRELSEWSRGYIATAARYGLVNGYPDGSFRPKNQITRGEAAILVVKAVGTPVQTAGVHSLGSTWGNVTITSSGVTLRDTVVGGNLYITGGVDLGEITLENVTVLGEIVISGGGVSEGGDDSIVLRNVNAPKLIVDNIPNQQISIRVEGDGVIEHTSVRTDAYLDDRTPAGYGLSKIALEGEDGLSLNLAGNVKEVTNLTPKSRIGVARGHVDTINVDEKASGVDLGEITLENVTVLGEIVISGGGVSEGGDDSIVLRNVNAPKLIVDNIPNQQISIRVEGDGVIEHTSVRTDAYLDDRTPAGYGLSKIALEGEDGLSLNLAGNVKEVTNLTPKSRIGVARGHVDTINVDEKATDSTLNIASGAEVDNVNLDVATSVTGDGDIGHLTVNAPGSTVTMLPDQITIRPGVEATIDGEKMDSEAAAESSADPRLLAGYPEVTDLAPTSATARFSANKKGTVYWAVTSVTDGSVGVDDLLNPSSYSPKIVKSGTLSLTGSSQPGSVKISGLTSDGSYYLSAVFVDAREERSPLKVISFTTPDNTVPNFASGYPYMSKITSTSGQVTTMATKSCRLYWAVLPKGASAPTANDFKANAVSGNLGFGTLDVTKNVSNTFDVNNVPLEELESYDLYLWLTDVDGGQSSAVKKVSFTTVDGTPPRFNTNPTVNKVNATSVGLYANLNEAGTLYWVVVKEGEEYPKPLAGQSGKVDLSSDNAKLQVSAGMNALKNGKVTMTEGKDVSFTVSGLEKETAYDLYYVAQDKAGNYSETVGKITIHTLDPNAPTVTQEFTKYNGTDSTTPLPNTDVRLVFSEGIQDAGTNQNLYELYQKVAAGTEPKSKLAGLLRDSIKLYQDTGNGPATQVVDYKDDKDNWTINYENVVIKQEDGKTVVVFPGSGGSADAALNLQSGATYYFEIEAGKIADTSESKNVMGKVTLDKFTTVFAQVNISTVNQAEITVGSGPDNKKTVNAVWKLDPVTTDKVGDFIDWDMLIWTDTNLSFNLYRSTDGGPWEQLNKKGEVTITLSSATEGFLGVSLTKDFLKVGETMTDFDPLNELKEGQTYEYAMEFTSVNGERDKQAWNGRVNIRVNVVAGKDNDLRMMATSVTEQNWMDTVVNGDLTDIGLPKDFTLKVPFSDQSIPEFTSGYPKFTPGATDAQMELLLNRPGTVYYVVAPKGDILTTDKDGNNYKDEPHYSSLPIEGDSTITMPSFNQPQVMDILNPEKSYSKNPSIKYDNTACQSSVVKLSVEDLSPQTDYIVYFVIQNTAQNYSEVQCYRFTTTDVGTPYITLNNQSPDVQFKTSESSELNYVLVAYNQIPDFLKGKFATEANMDQEDLKKFQSSGLNQDMTILEALIETVRQGSGNEGPSVFDMYAKASLRDRVGKLIRRNQSGDSMTTVASGPISLEKNVPQVKQFEQYMNMNTLYYCLAVARNKDGTEDGFKAIGGVNIPDNDPPVLTVTGGKANATGTGWSGTVTLSFSENLYWLSEDRQTLKEVWTKAPATPAEKKKAVYILDEAFGIGGSAAKKLKLASGALASPSGTFTFSYEGVVEGDTLVFFTTGYASDMNMNGRGMEAKTKTILTYVTEAGGTGQFLTNGRFVITQGAIEGDSPTT